MSGLDVIRACHENPTDPARQQHTSETATTHHRTETRPNAGDRQSQAAGSGWVFGAAERDPQTVGWSDGPRRAPIPTATRST